jgi:hypothetical protein
MNSQNNNPCRRRIPANRFGAAGKYFGSNGLEYSIKSCFSNIYSMNQIVGGIAIVKSWSKFRRKIVLICLNFKN